MKKTELGFGAVGVLLILLVLGVVGAGGYFVYKQNKSSENKVETNQSNTETQDQTSSSCSGEYTNEKIGISFFCPEGWSIEVNDKAENHVVGTIMLTSRDFKTEEEGYGGSKTGSRLYISIYKVEQLAGSYTPIASILDGTEQSKSTYTDVKPTKIAGINGASFIQGYEGPRILTNQFEHNGNQYSISLEEDIDGPEFNDNLDAYQKIVDSFELL